MTSAPHQTPDGPLLAERGLAALGTLPVACMVVTGVSALYMLLVAVGNITDFDTNEAFVRHVLAMDTTNFGAAPGTELDPDVIWRAIQSTAVQTAAYLVIIVWETLSALVLLYATALWFGALRARRFDAPRRVSTAGFLMLVLLFMAGFTTIGGEWFQMWRSDEWNGLQPAFHNSVLALFGIVLVHLPSREWAAMAAPEAEGLLAR
jgi:predicted small integral membrane protein